MQLKLDENGSVVLNEGKPVYVHADGKEIAFDAHAAVQKIGQLTTEAKTHREAKEAVEAKFSKIPSDFDFERATKALAIVQNLDDKKLVDAGEVDKLTAGRVQT